MMEIKRLILALFLLLSASGCSVEISQPHLITPSPENESSFPSVVPTISASSENTTSSNSAKYQIPVKWSNLGLTGRLVYSRMSSNDDIPALSVETLDLTTGEIKKVFTASEDARIYYSAVSPDGKELIISYVLPSDSSPSRNQALYRLPMDGSTPPQLLVTPPTGSDQYIQVEWSPDGKYIYYVHNNYSTQSAEQIYPNYKIFRKAYPDGQPEQIVEHAFWPRVSPDSSKLVYVSIDPLTGTNELFLANADGTNAQVINTGSTTEPGIRDAPFFTPDGLSIIFSAPSPAQSYLPNWLDRLMGVQIAKAHSLPSDWWIVPITGGEAARLTQIQATNLFARMSPDNKHVVSFSLDGLFVMGLDGSNLTSILPDSGGSTVDWIP